MARSQADQAEWDRGAAFAVAHDMPDIKAQLDQCFIEAIDLWQKDGDDVASMPFIEGRRYVVGKAKDAVDAVIAEIDHRRGVQ